MKKFLPLLIVVMVLALVACERETEPAGGTTNFDAVTANTFTGDLTGDVTGDVTGNVTGQVNGSYPIEYNTNGTAIDIGSTTVTDTVSISLSNVTTPTIGLCTLAEDVDANEANCSISISGTSATLKLWNAAGDGAGTAGTSVYYAIIGQE